MYIYERVLYLQAEVLAFTHKFLSAIIYIQAQAKALSFLQKRHKYYKGDLYRQMSEFACGGAGILGG